MPVAAKLSRNFYERFGDQVAGELVDWFNSVDTTYQNQLREMNELNWERFRAELRAEASSIRAELHSAIALLRAENQAEAASIRAEMHVAIAGIRTDMADLKSELLKWMFIYWTGSIVTLGGLIIALSGK